MSKNLSPETRKKIVEKNKDTGIVVKKFLQDNIKRGVAGVLVTGALVGCTVGSASATSRYENPAYKGVGFISVAEEVGPNGNGGFVSSGIGDAGGISYGLIQLTSKAGGSANTFVASLKKNHPEFYKFFEGAGRAGTQSFTKAWKEAYKSNPGEFEKIQLDYKMKTYVNPAVKLVKDSTGVDLLRSRALTEWVHATSVQFGAGGAREVSVNAGIKPSMSDEEIISALSQEKRNSVGTYKFLGCSSAVRKSVYNRFIREEKKMLEIAKEEKGPTIDETLSKMKEKNITVEDVVTTIEIDKSQSSSNTSDEKDTQTEVKNEADIQEEVKEESNTVIDVEEVEEETKDEVKDESSSVLDVEEVEEETKEEVKDESNTVIDIEESQEEVKEESQEEVEKEDISIDININASDILGIKDTSMIKDILDNNDVSIDLESSKEEADSETETKEETKDEVKDESSSVLDITDENSVELEVEENTNITTDGIDLGGKKEDFSNMEQSKDEIRDENSSVLDIEDSKEESQEEVKDESNTVIDVEEVEEETKEEVKDESNTVIDIEESQEEVKQEVQEETKVEAQEEAKQEVQEETKTEVQEEVKQESQEEAKQEVQEETKVESQEEVKQEVQEETKVESQEEAKQEVQEETKTEVQEEVKQESQEEAKQEVQEETKVESQEEVKQEVQEEVKQEVVQQDTQEESKELTSMEKTYAKAKNNYFLSALKYKLGA